MAMHGPRGNAPLLFSPGRNCWRVASCHRLGFIIDGKDYFDAITDSFAKARKRITILGWDFDSRVHLNPTHPKRDNPTLGDYLRRLVETNEDLEIYVLIWRNSVIYASNPDIPLLSISNWWDHPRIHYKLDDRHPVTACHHEKIILVDDAVAFIGGMDLTDSRWDDSHAPDDPYRRTTSNAPYAPVHDVQAVLDGDVARALSDIARWRWQSLTGTTVEPVTANGDPWPDNVRVAIRHHHAAIARTRPSYEDQVEVREIEAMNATLLESAQQSIYIETQYFALPEIAKLLAEHLAKADGPEVIIVTTLSSEGFVEQYVMAENRDRLFAELLRADRFGRLRTYYPVATLDPACDIKIHSKVIVIDDRLLRIGSSNLNSRSLGLDTECDIALEGTTVAARRAIAGLRNRLLAEHVGVTPRRFEAELRRAGSLIAAIEALNRHRRRLMDFAVEPGSQESLTPGSSLLDPPRPISLRYLWQWLTSSGP